MKSTRTRRAIGAVAACLALLGAPVACDDGLVDEDTGDEGTEEDLDFENPGKQGVPGDEPAEQEEEGEEE